jgi:hypothetical protein
MVILIASLLAAATSPCPETARTAAAVQCVEEHWSRAFMGGDAGYLNDLLSDGYHSYTDKGVARDHAAIVGFAEKYAKEHPGAVPPKSPAGDIQLKGETAVVFWHKPDGSLSSVDTFHWENGRWRAWYSQHSG